MDASYSHATRVLLLSHVVYDGLLYAACRSLSSVHNTTRHPYSPAFSCGLCISLEITGVYRVYIIPHATRSPWFSCLSPAFSLVLLISPWFSLVLLGFPAFILLSPAFTCFLLWSMRPAGVYRVPKSKKNHPFSPAFSLKNSPKKSRRRSSPVHFVYIIPTYLSPREHDVGVG